MSRDGDGADGELDPTRRVRRWGIASVAASLACLVALVPLIAVPFALVAPVTAVGLFFAGAIVQVVLGLLSAHLLFVARDSDRTRAQALCGWVGSAAAGLAAVGLAAMIAAGLFVAFIASLGPWCGVCGT